MFLIGYLGRCANCHCWNAVVNFKAYKLFEMYCRMSSVMGHVSPCVSGTFDGLTRCYAFLRYTMFCYAIHTTHKPIHLYMYTNLVDISVNFVHNILNTTSLYIYSVMF